MPRITLTAEEARELEVLSEKTVDVSTEEYERARLEALSRVPDGDKNAIREFVNKYPSSGELSQRQGQEDRRAQFRAELEARRARTQADLAGFYEGLDRIPDNDKAGIKRYLIDHGMALLDDEEIDVEFANAPARPNFMEDDDEDLEEETV